MTSSDRLDELKRKLLLYVAEQGEVSRDDLIKWAYDNNLGILALSIIINDVVRESKRISCYGRNDSILRIVTRRGEINIVVPERIRYVSAKRAESAKRVNILSLISSRNESVRDVNTVSVVSAQPEEAPRASELTLSTPKGHDVSHIRDEDKIISLIKGEVHDVNEDVLEIAAKMLLSYLARYWSVGELKIHIDLTPAISKRTGIPAEKVSDIILKLLKVLQKINVVEIVEPGVVNVIRRDLIRDASMTMKLSQVLAP